MKGSAGFMWGLTRIGLGWVFLWAFLDKTFGLGYSTLAEKSWLNGASPTMGFLSKGTTGPLAETFQGLAGNLAVDWLFMMGMLGVGAALILGIGMRIAVASGSLMMLLIYLAAMPPKTNPLVDDHIIYILVLLTMGLSNAGEAFGLGGWWKKTGLVKSWPILR